MPETATYLYKGNSPCCWDHLHLPSAWQLPAGPGVPCLVCTCIHPINYALFTHWAFQHYPWLACALTTGNQGIQKAHKWSSTDARRVCMTQERSLVSLMPSDCATTAELACLQHALFCIHPEPASHSKRAEQRMAYSQRVHLRRPPMARAWLERS